MRIRRPSFFALISFISLSLCILFGMAWIKSRRITIPARPSTYQVQAQLARKLPTVRFTNATLGDAIDFLRDVSGCEIQVDWSALESGGISRDTMINHNSISIA